MSPFEMVPPLEYKPENFFPCVTEEYRRCVRDEFCIKTQKEIDEFVEGPEFLDDEIDPFDYEKPNYDEDVYDGEPIKKGDDLDVIFFLSGGCRDGKLIRCVNNNPPYVFDKVGLKDSLGNKKYVLIVCVFAPAKWCQDNAESYSRLSVLSDELLAAQPNDFEMVIVAKMRHNTSTGCDYDADTFEQFLSAFPGRLAVPYSEAEIRDSVCATLGFEGDPIKAVLVGPDSTVLQDDVDMLIDYGSVGFPFTDDRLETLGKEREQISLSGLLGRDPSFRLHKFNSHEETESQSIEQLNEKVVGLYLFQRGDKLPSIHKVYNECRDRNRAKGMEPQFEIVIVCMPLFGSTNPHVFQEEVFSLLNRLELDFSSWWVFSYDNSACLRLWEMSRRHANAEDGMIIVGPGNSFFEPCAAHVIRDCGISAYPFTRKGIVERYVERAKNVTLDSLLLPPYDNTKRTHAASMTLFERADGEQVPLAELRGKNVLFYFYHKSDTDLREMTITDLVDWYPKIKQVDPYFELLFVTCKDSHVDIADKIPKSWIVCLCESDHFTYLWNDHEAFYKGCAGSKFLKGIAFHSVLAFGKDGYLHSLNALQIRHTHGSNAFPFDPVYKDLRRHIVALMREDFDFMYGV